MATIFLTGTARTGSETIHISQDEWISTYCGKDVESFAFETHGPATCKTCLRAFELSSDYRIARKLETLAWQLYDDMKARPGAYTHADRNAIELMVIALEQEPAALARRAAPAGEGAE